MKPSDEDYERLRWLEEGLWRAETHFDKAWMREVLAEDFFEFGRSGRVYRREETLAIPSQTIPAVLPRPGLEVQLIPPDVAHATYDGDLDAVASLGG